MSDPKTTLGIQHKNYLNLKLNPKNPWQGSTGCDAQGHAIFLSPDWNTLISFPSGMSQPGERRRLAPM